MVKQEVSDAFEVLKAEDKKYIKKILEDNKNAINYDEDYCGWTIVDNEDGKTYYIVDYLFKRENTYLNPKELESTIDTLMIEEIISLQEIAEDFISYYEAKYGLEDVTEDKIYSNISKDCEFRQFAIYGLPDEVIEQLRRKGVDVE